ncbi:hypothetical protein EDB81DRAFT_828982 [Dactylonectria macrodidyma]|uniref:Uncharacterized protein n=1 Tax=Dactylonectria macrodidyma TaxID=307937 RepID=A0A9P9I8L9_9HYPO|nr:hypothetical protein EDB81DRAFT_828982 [Dactylonectria macrodidyma]
MPPKPRKTAAEKAAAAEAEAAVAANARKAAIAALREDLGVRAFDLLPKKVHDIDTYDFAYKTEMPDSNPDITVWALLNALKGCTTKGLEAIDPDKAPRLLEVRTKKKKKSKEEEPYTMNFAGGQNCDAMLRHLYGDEREDTDRCNKCTKNLGALKGCMVIEGVSSCANCDWNRSGAACSLTKRGTKRKSAEASDDSGSDSTDPFEDLDHKTCQKLAQIFKAATNRKKHKRSA